MRFLIVGGSGFIGTRLCKRLKVGNHLIKILDKNRSVSFGDHNFIHDVRFPINLKLETDVIINLAAEHRDDVFPLTLYDETNINGAKNVCQLARDNGVSKIVFTSSVAVYGFAPPGADEVAPINPFNDYGRTKWEAEKIYKAWQQEDPDVRLLVIVRPTVVFGEQNRGNVFNLLNQIASGRFIMVGDGLNRKSMAYVENVAAFLEFSCSFSAGVHIYNYIDKPDFVMNQLIEYVSKLMGRQFSSRLRLPFSLGLLIGNAFDLVAKLTKRKFPVSAIRVKKFCANSVYQSSISETNFSAPVDLLDAIKKTVFYEFIENHKDNQIFYSE